MLALNLAYNNINAIMVLSKPPTKKKYKLGNRSIVMLFSIKTANSITCNSKGILRCEIFESIMVSILPKVLNR